MSDDNSIIIVKKKKKGHEGHHGGAWKVAYADFVTAMMAFFLLMWLINTVKPETKVALSKYFKDESPITEGGLPTPSTDIDIPPRDAEIPDDMSENLANAMRLEEEMREIVEEMLFRQRPTRNLINGSSKDGIRPIILARHRIPHLHRVAHGEHRVHAR